MPFRFTRLILQRRSARVRVAFAALAVCAVLRVQAQSAEAVHTRSLDSSAASRRATAFVRGRLGSRTTPATQGASALGAARVQQLDLVASPQATSLSVPWTAVGPLQVQTPAYGLVTGRVTAAAIDPSDTTGNTVYLGTSGGGVWKSTNAANSVSAVTFQPLTDTLPVYSPNTGTSVIPSLSIGAVSVQPGGTGILLAGTGDPNDAADSYYGAGVLRSADNGVTWSLIQNGSSPTGGVYSFVGQGIAGFAWSTVSPQLVVAAVSSSAESAVVGDDQFPGVRGLYYSTNGGVTWNIATIQDGSNIVQNRFTSYINFRGNAATSVVWNPVRKRFYAAVRFHGYYESTDGMTWTRLANQPGSGLTTTICPTRPGDYGAQNCPIFRGALTVQPISGDLFALTVDAHNADQGLWQDACALSGAACASPTVVWGSKLDATPMESAGAISHGDYNLTLAAVPVATSLSASDTLLFAGAGDLYRCSLAGGCTLRNATNATTGCSTPAGVAPAQHAIAWQANLSNAATPLLYFGNDGGLWRSTDGVSVTGAVCNADDANHVDNLNGALGSLAEVSSLSSHPTDPNTLMAALGANGSAASTTSAQATNLAPWMQLSPGESGTVAIDQGNGSVWLAQSGAGIALHTCSNGAACTGADFAGPAAVGSTQTSGDMALVDPPVLLDPVLNSDVIAGTCRVWRGPTAGGAAWSVSNAISPFLAGPAEPACNSNDASIRSLAAGGAVALTGSAQTSGSPILYAGLSGIADGGSTFGGRIFVTTGANLPTAVWTDRTTSTVTNDPAGFNPGQFDVSSISVDPNDATGQTVYATILGFGYPHVYRSTNAGATWTNISANLPNAPANALAVDPNDARIVYVAVDTGVYVTTDVGSCISPSGGTVNCWSVMGAALPNAPVLSLVASRGITAPGALSAGVLRAGTFGRGIWQQPLLSAGTASVPVASFSPASLAFSTTQQVGSTSAPQTLTLTNTGTAAMTISTVAASAGFVETDNCAGTTLAVNAACTLQVYFAPVTQGANAGTLQVFANVAGGYASAALIGTGVGVPNVVLSPSSLAFASTAVHATSATQSITVNNNGTAALPLGARVITGDFALTADTCGSNLAAGATCTLSVSFTPTASGPRSGFLSLTDANATHTIALSGAGVAGVLSLSATTVAFHDTDLSATSSANIVTVSNTGTGTLNIANVAVTGDFAATSGCNNTALAPGRSCTVSITFTPTAVGTRTGTLTLISDTGGTTGTQTSAGLTGTGRGAFSVVLTPTSVNFGNQLTDTTSPVTNITISNTGKQSGAITSIAVSGDYVLKANTCGPSLASQVGCTVSIAFVPSAGSTRNGLLTVVDDAGTQTATLTGVGTAAATDTLSPLSLVFGTQQVNTASASQSVTLTNSGDTPLTLVASQILAGDFTTVNGCGPTLAAHSACSIGVTFVPGSVGTRTGTLQVSDVQHIQTVALSGTAIAGPGVSLTPSTLTFASTGIGAVTAGQTLTLTNNGGIPLQVSAITVTGDFVIPADSGTCSNTSALTPGSSCTLQIVFAPTAAGARAGTVSIQSNAATQTTHLAGMGVDFSLNPNGPTSLTIASGSNAVYPLLLRPAVNTSDPVTYTCAGAPINATCKIVAQYNDLSSTGTVTVTVLTGTSATAKRITAAILLPLLLAFSWKRRRRGILVAMVACALLLGSVSCGVGRKSADSGDGSSTGAGGSSPTPAGTYSITVSATAAGIIRSVPLTLVVQ